MCIENDIKADYLEENICNDIRFIVDMQGASAHDVEECDLFISKLLDSNLYKRLEGTYTYEDINEWDQRAQRSVANVVKRRIIESEKVICYASKNESELIFIGKLYIEIKLARSQNDSLKQKIKLLQDIVKAYISVNPFIEIENIFLIKRNNIICGDLYKLYSCYEANVFGDVRKEIADSDMAFTEYHSSSIAVLKEYNLNIEKGIVAGEYNEKEAYMGELNFSMSCQMQYGRECSNLSKILKDMDENISNIFKKNLTTSFSLDLEKRNILIK